MTHPMAEMDQRWPQGVRGIYHFKIDMTCDGCVQAITRNFKKLDCVKDVSCDIEKQACDVTTWTQTDEPLTQKLIEQITPWAQSAGKQVQLTTMEKIA